MRGWAIALIAASALCAKDERHLELMRQAQAAFDRVQQSSTPELASASDCVQAQAAMLSIALPLEVVPLRFHQGYCELAHAAITREPAEFTGAAADLEKGGDPLLAWLSRIQSAPYSEPPTIDLRQYDNAPHFAAAVRSERIWRGFMAWKGGRLEDAARFFSGLTETGWPAWIAGLQAFQKGQYADAMKQYRQALAIWTDLQQSPVQSLWARLAPPTDVAAALIELGGAQLLAGDPPGAISTLNTALRGGPPTARLYYLRARAKELAGQAEPSLADYNLASRTAFADAQDLASGEAHLYRGIMLYRRKDFGRAEDEFAQALNLAIPPALQPDAAAWRHLAAVAGGSCTASREHLELSLPAVSPFFPKDEAKAMAAACASSRGGV